MNLSSYILVFDLGNVLIDLNFKRFVEGASRISGIDPKKIYRRYIMGERKREYERGQILSEEFIGEMAEWLSWPSGKNELLQNLWCDVFDPVDEAESHIDLLSRNSNLWLLSDTNDLHWQYLLRQFPILQNFLKFFLSYQRGLLKTDAGAFEDLVDEAEGRSDRILFFDDLPENIVAAKIAGLNAHKFITWGDVENIVQKIY